MYKHFVKRLLDIVLSVLALIMLVIPMVIIGICIKIDSPGPVFFKQQRIGKGKKLFTIYKFRSMPITVPKDVATHQLDVQQITLSKFQRCLRSSSCDELPQCWNILRGDMSIIGPRPALWNQYDLIDEREKYNANDVRPGLTGLAQINGRDELEISDKARLDGEYAAALNAGKFKGFRMDVKCFFGTIVSVLKRDGVVEGGTGEMKKQEEEKQEVTK